MSRDNSSPPPEGAVILASSSPAVRFRALGLIPHIPTGFMLTIVTAPSFLKRTSVTVCQVGNHGPIGDSWPIAFLGCPRGHRVPQRLVHEAHWPNFRFDTLSRTRASQEPDWHRQG